MRTRGAPDRVYVHRDDGSETGWSFPTYGDELPHDLVHLVVETVFDVKEGFWGRVARGVDPARLNALANRQGGKAKYAGFGDDLSELHLAEALANARWADAQATDEERRDDMARECAKAGIELPASATLAAIARARTELAGLRDRWRSIVRKAAIELTF
ncbi:MAG TPA: hypothetical protein VFF73_33320 [Planctomycetota bacterium]|nr:hypothetical protein [Planctomycetota bacterium]